MAYYTRRTYNTKKKLISKETIKSTPSTKGIYILKLKGHIVYIGKTVCIKKRLWNHWASKTFDEVEYFEIENQSDINIFEIYLISKFKPPLNKDCMTSDYPSIYIDASMFKSKKIEANLNVCLSSL